MYKYLFSAGLVHVQKVCDLCCRFAGVHVLAPRDYPRSSLPVPPRRHNMVAEQGIQADVVLREATRRELDFGDSVHPV